jgi:alcohol dehydrogenase (cytochrome c)
MNRIRIGLPKPEGSEPLRATALFSLIAVTLGYGLSTGTLHAQTQASFAAEQAAAGKQAYAQNCARCHGEHLDDGEFGPALSGRTFSGRWSQQPLADLFTKTRTSMPPDAPGSLPEEKYIDILAYVLSQNGVSPGTSLPSDPKLLAAMHMPGSAPARPLGPSGGLAPGAALPPPPPKPDPLQDLTPVTEAMLKNPPAADWISWRRAFDDSGFSPLTDINKSNVGQLRLAWSLALPAGPNEATPLVHDGVIFVHAYGDHVFALDAASGDELWHYSRALPESTSPVVQRSLALYGNNLYFGTSDAHEVALDAKTGRLVWDHQVADPKVWKVSGGALVARGRVMQGVVGRGAGGAFIVGLDAQSGAEVWRFHSIAQTGDANEKTWNETPLEKRNGGSVWTAGSYDPDLNLAYFGPAQTYDTAPLQHPVKKRGISNDGLYLDATVAIEPETGHLKWYFQHVHNDQWDYDWAFERQRIELNVDGRPRQLVITSGKLGIYDALDAATGKYAFSIDMGIQNLITHIDPKSGEKTIDMSKYPGFASSITVCPHAGGGRSWLPGSYNSATHVVYAAMVESCMEMIQTAEGERGSLSSGYRWTLKPRPDSDGQYGRIQAIDLTTRQTLWKTRQRAPQSSGVLDTAGGVLFAGSLDRRFSAYDDRSGEKLWSARLSDVPSAAPISYTAGGKQYVAMIVGYGGAQAVTFPALVPDIKLPPTRSSAIVVFALP